MLRQGPVSDFCLWMPQRRIEHQSHEELHDAADGREAHRKEQDELTALAEARAGWQGLQYLAFGLQSSYAMDCTS
jgi:hypothetical protein